MPLLQVSLGSTGGKYDFGPLLALHSRLFQTGLHLQEAEALFERDGTPIPESRSFLRAFANRRNCQRLVFASAQDN